MVGCGTMTYRSTKMGAARSCSNLQGPVRTGGMSGPGPIGYGHVGLPEAHRPLRQLPQFHLGYKHRA